MALLQHQSRPKEQSVQSLSVEADYYLVVYQRNWGSHHTQLLQFGQGSLVLGYVALNERHVPL